MRGIISRTVALASLGAFGVVIFACGSDGERAELTGPSGGNGSGTGSSAAADAGLFSPTTPGVNPGNPAQTSCNDPSNATAGCNCPTEGAEAACWTGPANLRRVEQCREGKASCIKQGEFLRWGPCTGEVLPNTPNVDANCLSTCKGECVPGKWRYCDEANFCAWGKQDCLPNGKGGGSWGPCKETTPPAGCEPLISFPGIPPIYEEDCCLEKGFCCQIGGVDSPISQGNCAGIVVTCQ